MCLGRGVVTYILHLCWQEEKRESWSLSIAFTSGPIPLKGPCSFQQS